MDLIANRTVRIGNAALHAKCRATHEREGNQVRRKFNGEIAPFRSSRPGKSHCQHAGPDYVGSVNWQTLVSLGIVALAVTALLWGKFRRRKFNFHRDTHCGCAAPDQSSTHQSIIFHARKGERPQVIVKKK